MTFVYTVYTFDTSIQTKTRKVMKTIKAPKDGKKYVANGRRFATIEEVRIYASSIDCYIDSTENWKGLVLCDLGSLNARENMPS